jgi:hypothetical protein
MDMTNPRVVGDGLYLDGVFPHLQIELHAIVEDEPDGQFEDASDEDAADRRQHQRKSESLHG